MKYAVFVLVILLGVVTAPCAFGAGDTSSSAQGQDPSAEMQVRFYHPGDSAKPPPGRAAANLLSNAKAGKINGLTWQSFQPELVERTDARGETTFYAEAHGLYPGEDRALLIGRKRIEISSEGEFTAEFPVTDEAQAASLIAIDMRGTIQEETIVIEVPHFAELKKKRLLANKRTRPFSIGIGYTSLDYQETGIQDVHQPSLTIKAGYRGALGSGGTLSRITYSLSGYMTMAALSSNNPDATMRFLGLNGRFGYAIPRLFGADSTWSANLGFGYYFATMLVSASDPSLLFGFRNLMGLQLFPTITKSFNGNNSVTAYFKFSPVSSGIAVTDLGINREIATGLLYKRRLSSSFDLLFTLDWANLDYQLEGSQIQVNSLTLGVGVGF